MRPNPPFFQRHWSPGYLSSEIKQLGVDPTTHSHLQLLPIQGTPNKVKIEVIFFKYTSNLFCGNKSTQRRMLWRNIAGR
jgi:hypothetical protein